jgi:hypothetical protein
VSRVTVFAHFPGWKARGRPHRGRAQVRQPGGVTLVLALLPVTDFAAGAGSRRNSEHPSAPKHPEEPSHQPGPTSGPQPWAGTATGIRAASQSAAQTAALGAVAKIGLPVTGVPAVSTGPRREVLDERLAGHKELRRGGRVLPGLRRAERPARRGRERVAAGHGPDLVSRHCWVARWSRRSPHHRKGTYADMCLRGPVADLSLPVEAARVVASGSCALSAVMRLQPGRRAYQRARDRRQPHNRALRGIGARWVRILRRCWTDGTIYDPGMHPKTSPGDPGLTPAVPPGPAVCRGRRPPAFTPAAEPAAAPPEADSGSLHHPLPRYRGYVDTGRAGAGERG